jgi:Ca2+/Na+ antiporter
MGSWMLLGILVGVSLTLNVVGLIVSRRIGRSTSPRAVRKRHRWIVFNHAVSFGMLGCLLLFQRAIDRHTAVLFGLILASVGPLVWLMMRRPTEEDAQKNFAHDPGHCGRCEYDLTGNVSGVCPECGWVIPKTPVRLENPKWAFWWREWEIDYLENWRRTLRTMRINAVMFAAVGVLMWAWGCRSESQWFMMLLTLLLWLLGGHMLILSIRVAAYGRKQGNRQAGDKQEPRPEVGGAQAGDGPKELS